MINFAGSVEQAVINALNAYAKNQLAQAALATKLEPILGTYGNLLVRSEPIIAKLMEKAEKEA